MSRTTTLTGVITLAAKSMAITEQVAIREKINLHLTGYGAAGAADLILCLVHEGVMMAYVTPLVDSTTYLSGVLDTNTTPLATAFTGMAANAKIKMSVVLYDLTNDCCLVNDWIWVLNNPYATGMPAPAAVDPVIAVTYALVANGITNGDSHTHQAGAGGDLTPYFIARTPNGGFFRQSTDGFDIELRDRVRNTWHTLILANGSLGIGPAI